MERKGMKQLTEDKSVICSVVIKNGIDKQIITDCSLYRNIDDLDEIVFLIKDAFKGTEVQVTITKI